MARLKILQYPDALLREGAQPVGRIDARVATVIENLAETMYAAPGLGLAATQVGIPERIIVLDVHGPDEAPGKRLLKLINPEIAEREGEIVWEEGCLSVPDLTAPVKRARRVLVRAWTTEEKQIEVEAEELLAVALQTLPRPPVPDEARLLSRPTAEARAPGTQGQRLRPPGPHLMQREAPPLTHASHAEAC